MQVEGERVKMDEEEGVSLFTRVTPCQRPSRDM